MTLSLLRDERDMADVPYPERYPDLPTAVMEALWRYETKRATPGRFTLACLCNNLTLAALSADNESAACLVDIARMMHNELRSDSWGSPEVVNRWLGGRR